MDLITATNNAVHVFSAYICSEASPAPPLGGPTSGGGRPPPAAAPPTCPVVGGAQIKWYPEDRALLFDEIALM